MKKEIDKIKNLETPADANESRSIKRRIKKLRKNLYAHRNTTRLSITEEEYKEYGISYDTVARKLGVCRQKTVEIVKFALKYRLITKKKRVVQMHMKDVGICSNFVFPDGLPKGFFARKIIFIRFLLIYTIMLKRHDAFVPSLTALYILI